MSLRLSDLREYVVRPVLHRLRVKDRNLWSVAAENLVLGTGLVESGYTWLDQSVSGPGPAYGPWQMEELTHLDLWSTFIPYQPRELRESLLDIAGHDNYLSPPVTELHGNLFYGAAMCRVRYLRVRPPLPDAHDAEGMAAYWKLHYNTPLGKGTIEKAIPFFKQVTT